MKLILGGHWNKGPEGWTALTERDQDITRRLRWADNSVDAIFTEHVLEHIAFIPAIGFLREAFRVLKPGGILRVVAPMVDVFTQAEEKEPQELMIRYCREQMAPYYKDEIAELQKFGLALNFSILPFIVDFLVRKHGHQFCWSTRLLSSVISGIGFSKVSQPRPGHSAFDLSTCLERTIRGTHGEIAQADFGKDLVFDPESGIVEAVK